MLSYNNNAGTRISKLKGRLKARSASASNKASSAPADPSAPPPPPPVHAVKEWMAKAGTALIVRVERLPSPDCKAEGGEYAGNKLAQRAAPLIELRHMVDAGLGLPTTVHIYMNERPGSQTLTLHADESDVLVVQVNGTKAWEVCAPATLPAHLSDSTSDEERASVEAVHARMASLNHLHLKSTWDDHQFKSLADMREQAEAANQARSADGSRFKSLSGGAAGGQ